MPSFSMLNVVFDDTQFAITTRHFKCVQVRETVGGWTQFISDTLSKHMLISDIEVKHGSVNIHALSIHWGGLAQRRSPPQQREDVAERGGLGLEARRRKRGLEHTWLCTGAAWSTHGCAIAVFIFSEAGDNK